MLVDPQTIISSLQTECLPTLMRPSSTREGDESKICIQELARYRVSNLHYPNFESQFRFVNPFKVRLVATV